MRSTWTHWCRAYRWWRIRTPHSYQRVDKTAVSWTCSTLLMMTRALTKASSTLPQTWNITVCLVKTRSKQPQVMVHWTSRMRLPKDDTLKVSKCTPSSRVRLTCSIRIWTTFQLLRDTTTAMITSLWRRVVPTLTWSQHSRCPRNSIWNDKAAH